jgi:omega-6 fatty acid desaturase (delta-12 desaturase)
MSVVAERDVLKKFQRPTWRSPVQLATTATGLAAGWFLTDRAMAVSWALGAVSSLVIAVFTVRAFIIFHDCGHGSFTHSRRLNTLVGTLIGVIVFTPYAHWTRAHIRHHATTGDLDRRGTGDVWTMTTDEYRAASPGRRLYYRIYHHPFFLMTIGPLIKFVIVERLILDPKSADRRLRVSVYLTNLAIVGFAAAMAAWMGPSRYIAVQLMVLTFGGIPAVYLFYVQHRFPGTYWRRHADWDYLEASLASSSRVALPRFLQWVTGNIGFHHIHHLAPRIPNYLLPQAQAACPQLRPGATLTLRSGAGVLRTNLWDEAAGHFVTFAEAGF